MNNVYSDLADALNALPNGFPRTETGSDIKLLEYMYTEKEAELASKLTIAPESVKEIAERLDRSEKYIRKVFSRIYKKLGHRLDITNPSQLSHFLTICSLYN